MGSVRDVLSEQLAANRSSERERAAFAGHRGRLTELCLRGVPAGSARTLCVLGAGNANDLELAELAEHYGTLHLVDLDADALSGAVSRASGSVRRRLVTHAPVDVSGMLDRLERWADGRVTPEELAGHAAETSARLRKRVACEFDCVLSACLLTQMQLGLLTVLGDRHPLFEAARYTLTLSHLTVLTRLTLPGGRILLATDLTSGELAPAVVDTPDAELPALVERLVAQGDVFQVAQPALLRAMAAEDPWLSSELAWLSDLQAWRWQNGPSRLFLVYALEGRRRSAPPRVGR